jgi:hypothetical protein
VKALIFIIPSKRQSQKSSIKKVNKSDFQIVFIFVRAGKTAKRILTGKPGKLEADCGREISFIRPQKTTCCLEKGNPNPDPKRRGIFPDSPLNR